MNALKALMEEKKWSLSELTRKYGAAEAPELEANEAIKKYGSLVRKAVSDPDHTKHATVKRLIEVLGGELVVKIKREEEISL